MSFLFVILQKFSSSRDRRYEIVVFCCICVLEYALKVAVTALMYTEGFTCDCPLARFSCTSYITVLHLYNDALVFVMLSLFVCQSSCAS